MVRRSADQPGAASPVRMRRLQQSVTWSAAVELVEERRPSGGVAEHEHSLDPAGDGDVQHPALLLDVLG